MTYGMYTPTHPHTRPHVCYHTSIYIIYIIYHRIDKCFRLLLLALAYLFILWPGQIMVVDVGRAVVRPLHQKLLLVVGHRSVPAFVEHGAPLTKSYPSHFSPIKKDVGGWCD